MAMALKLSFKFEFSIDACNLSAICFTGDSEPGPYKPEKNDKVVVNHNSVATIVGSTMGSLAVVLTALAIFICYRRRKKAKAKQVL